MNELNEDVLKIILQPFQNNEESFLVGMTCKRFNKFIKRNKSIKLNKVLCHYILQGDLSTLKWFKYLIELKCKTEIFKGKLQF